MCLDLCVKGDRDRDDDYVHRRRRGSIINLDFAGSGQTCLGGLILHLVGHRRGVIIQLPGPVPVPVTITVSVVTWVLSDRGGHPVTVHVDDCGCDPGLVQMMIVDATLGQFT